MGRKRSGEIPDFIITCEGYELGAVEVGNDITDSTKELNDGSIKLGKIMKCMLRNVVEIPNSNIVFKYITGMFIAGETEPHRPFITISSSSLFITRVKNLLPSIIKSDGICLCASQDQGIILPCCSKGI